MRRTSKSKPSKPKTMKMVIVNGRKKYVYTETLQKEFDIRTGRGGCSGCGGRL